MRMIIRRSVIAGMVSAVVIATQYSATAQAEKVVARLTNKLGVDSQVEAASVTYAQTMPELLCPKGFFFVKIDQDYYVAVPPSAFKEARLENTKHSITLSSGKKLTGELMGELIGEVENGTGNQPRKYALSSSTLLTVQVTKGTQSVPEGAKNPMDKWQLAHHNADVSSYILQRPEFAFVYYNRHKVMTFVGLQYVDEWKTDTLTKRTPSFVIDVGGEKIPATISDFAEVSLKPGKQTEITLTSASGVKTTGGLILKSDDDIAQYWALVAEIEGSGGAMLILLSPQCSIKKVAEQNR